MAQYIETRIINKKKDTKVKEEKLTPSSGSPAGVKRPAPYVREKRLL